MPLPSFNTTTTPSTTEHESTHKHPQSSICVYENNKMRAATLIILALAAAAPAVGQKYHHSCDYISKSDSSGVPDKLKFKCKRTGGKSDDCTELTLADCIGVDILYGSLEGRK